MGSGEELSGGGRRGSDRLPARQPTSVGGELANILRADGSQNLRNVSQMEFFLPGESVESEFKVVRPRHEFFVRL